MPSPRSSSSTCAAVGSAPVLGDLQPQRRGRDPVRSSAAATWPGSRRRSALREARFTDTSSDRPSSSQLRHSASAVSSTHRVSGPSARLLGDRRGTRPGDEAGSGCSQRTSASTRDPAGRAGRPRLVVQDELVGRRSRAAGDLEAEGSRLEASRSGRVDLAAAAGRPSRGTSRRRRAASARRRLRRAPGRSRRRCSRRSSAPGRRRRSAARERCADAAATASASSVSAPSSSTPNSSPPRRPSRSSVAERLAQARADLARAAGPGRMAERVVDLLEAVEVDQQERQLPVVLALGDRVLEPIVEPPAVRQAGELVGDRLATRSASSCIARKLHAVRTAPISSVSVASTTATGPTGRTLP